MKKLFAYFWLGLVIGVVFTAIEVVFYQVLSSSVGLWSIVIVPGALLTFITIEWAVSTLDQ
jgi:hypothetical protein